MDAHGIPAYPRPPMSLRTFARLAIFLLATAGARAQSADVPDTIAQRMAGCVVCHGKEGRATNQGFFPRIAGKPAGYLYNQLVNFREGRRNFGPMNNMLRYLSDDYLHEIADYFAQLDLPYPPPQTVGADPAQLARGDALTHQGDPARGVPACAACHGAALTGVVPAIPGLLGLPRDYINGELGAWREGIRHAQAPDCMADIARKLDPADVAAVATWLSSQPPGAAHPAANLPEPPPLRCGVLAQ
jgi:cytochrome c553